MTVKQCEGFTCIELLVVIAVIAVLMGILTPVLNRAREHGKRAVCQSSLKQLSLAWILYSDDNDGRLVNGPAGGYNDSARHHNERPWVGKCWADNYQLGEQLPEVNQEVEIKKGALWPHAEFLKLYRCPTAYRGELLSFAIVHSMNGNPPNGTYIEVDGRRKPKTEAGVRLWVRSRYNIHHSEGTRTLRTVHGRPSVCCQEPSV